MAKLSASKKQDLLQRYRDRIESSRKHRESEGLDELWEKLVDLYRGKHFPKTITSQDRIAVNLVFATINVIAPSIAVNDPKMVVYAQKNEEQGNATIVETALNYWWRHFDFQPEVALAVKDYLVVGHGWLKVGWRFVEEPKTLARMFKSDPKDDDSDPAPTPQNKKEKPANDVDDVELDEDEPMEVSQDRPFVERVSFKDIFTCPEAKTLPSVPWIAQKIVKPYAEVMKDERYTLKGRKSMKPDSMVNPSWRNSEDKTTDDMKRVTLWEFYDITIGTMCVFPEMGDEFLIEPIPQPYAYGHPFVMLRNYEVPDVFYPMGDVEALEPLQLELDKTRSQIMNHRRRYDRKWLYRQNSFDEQGVAALQLDQDNVMVPVADDTNPLNDIIVPIPITSIDQQLAGYVQEIEQDLDKVSGVSEFQQGQSPDIRHTATEASMIADAANSRAADKLRQIEKLMGNVGRRVIMLAQQYLTVDQEARIMGQNGHPIWVPFDRKQIQGEFDYVCEAGSTKPLNETQRRQQAVQMLQTFTPYASAGLVNAQELIKYALQYGFGVQQPDKFMMMQMPDQGGPGEQQKSPRQSLVETMNYKDAPPDIQRQIEQAAGFTPSQVGGSSPAEGLMAKGMQPHIQAAAQAPVQAQQQQAQGQQSVIQQALQAATQHEQMQKQHIHEASMAHEQRKHERVHTAQQHKHKVVEGQVGHAQSIQQGAQQHAQALEQGAQGNQNAMQQQMMGAALQPPGGPEGEGGPETTNATE